MSLDLQVDKVLTKRRRIWARWLYVAALRLDDGELLIVVTADAPESAISDYVKRWGKDRCA